MKVTLYVEVEVEDEIIEAGEVVTDVPEWLARAVSIGGSSYIVGATVLSSTPSSGAPTFDDNGSLDALSLAEARLTGSVE